VIVDSRAVSDAVRKHQGQDGVEKLYLYSRPPGSLPAGTKMNQFDDIQKYPAYASITNNGNRYMKLSEDLWREDKKTRSFDSHGYMTDKDIFGLPGDKIAL